MQKITLIVQIILAVLLIFSILLQSRSGGLGSAFTSVTEQYRSKRGFEKLLFRLTIILTSLFLVTSIINLLVQ